MFLGLFIAKNINSKKMVFLTGFHRIGHFVIFWGIFGYISCHELNFFKFCSFMLFWVYLLTFLIKGPQTLILKKVNVNYKF